MSLDKTVCKGVNVGLFSNEEKNMTVLTPIESTTSCPIAVLTNDLTNQPVGFRIGQLGLGPDIVVMGHGTSTAVFQAWLMTSGFEKHFSGSLTVLSLDDLPDLLPDTIQSAINAPKVDDVLLLPTDAAEIAAMADRLWQLLPFGAGLHAA